MLLDLSGKVGLVMGIANEKSIAYGCSEIFKSCGAELIMTYSNEKSLPFVRKAIEKFQPKLFLPCNVEKEEEFIQLFDNIRQTYGKLDFLLHAIAYAPKVDLQGRVTDCSREGFLQSMDISCYSFIKCAKLAEPLMKDGGSILTLSYYGGEKVIKNYNVMGIAKAALQSTTRYLAYELGSQKIRVNAISPGPVLTRAATGIDGFDKLLQEAQESAPLRRLITTRDVGNMAAFLVSDASSNITGQVHLIDAGYSILG